MGVLKRVSRRRPKRLLISRMQGLRNYEKGGKRAKCRGNRLVFCSDRTGTWEIADFDLTFGQQMEIL